MQILWVGLGGALGAMLRHSIAHWSNSAHTWVMYGVSWPTGTLLVNALGCFIAGSLMGWLQVKTSLDQRLMLMISAGFLGAFTTFSAFAVDSVRLFDQAGLLPAMSYVLIMNVVCMALVFLGWWLFS